MSMESTSKEVFVLVDNLNVQIENWNGDEETIGRNQHVSYKSYIRPNVDIDNHATCS